MTTAEAAIDFGELPTGWTQVPVRTVVRKRRKLVGGNSASYKLLSLTLRGVIVRDLTGMKGKFPASFETYQVVEPGDLVLCMFDVEETPRTVGLSRHHGMITGAYDVYRSDDSLALEYLTRLLLVLDENKALAPLYRGLRKTIPRSAFESLKVPMPSKDEQGLIVRYLDHAELRIAKAIAAKTELARLLQQQRLALLCSDVLGRDEDADASRDFGRLVEGRVLDWVGPVPASWDVVPMSGVFDVVKQKNNGLMESTVLSLSYGRVVIKPPEKLRGLVPESFETYQVIEPGDVIVRPTDLQNDTNSLRIGQARDRGIITSAYIALRPKKHVDPDYVMMQLAAYDFLKVLYGFGSGLRQNLDFKHLKHVPMMLPSLAEQSAIVSRVRAKTESVEQAHAAILKEIALLKEYRTRLISDVVTGKLDVRDEAAKLPEIDPMELATVAVGENGDDEEATDDD
jgi:type I restriction enzyme S subunit